MEELRHIVVRDRRRNVMEEVDERVKILFIDELHVKDCVKEYRSGEKSGRELAIEESGGRQKR